MSSIRSVAIELRQVLTQVAEAAARASGCVQRQRRFSGATLVQTLVLGWLAQAAASLESLARMAATRGVVVTAQALDRRFTPALAACLEQVLSQLVRTVVVSDPVATPLLARFNGVYVLDSTTISLPEALAAQWPGCGGQAGQGRAALKVGVCLDLSDGGLTGPELVPGRRNDRSRALHQARLPAESLRISDLGFFKVADLARIDAEAAFFLTRWQANTALADPDGARWEDVGARLTALARASADGSVDVPVLVGRGERLAVRLLAVRVPAPVAAQRRREKRRRAQRAGYTARQASLTLCDWTILLTNVPLERLSGEEARVLLRLRWQIELLFKRWKGIGAVDQWRSAKPVRIYCEVLAKLIGCVLQHWVLVVGCWTAPDRSLSKASQVVQAHALCLAQALDRLAELVAALERLVTALGVGCRLNPRQQRPNAAQLLADPALGGLS